MLQETENRKLSESHENKKATMNDFPHKDTSEI